MQLLQYAPTTAEVNRRPLLIIPPWINKYYILDLREKNSFIKWAVDQGHTVFIVSWVNPDETLSAKTFDDYMLEGPLAAFGAIEKATGEKEINVDRLLPRRHLACLHARLYGGEEDEGVASATFLTTLVDFTEPGELGVFIDEEQLQSLESRMKEKGYLEGSAMANTFNMLRANDLIWSFVVNNYLLGKEPFPFDLLYWNANSTRMPAAMHSLLPAAHVPGEPAGEAGRALAQRHAHRPAQDPSTLLHPLHQGRPHRAVEIDLCRDPALQGPGALRARGLGPCRGRGQSAGGRQVSPLDQRQEPAGPGAWLARRQGQRPGSWWPGWNEWVAEFSGGKVKARKPGDGKLKPIEDAPGSYVKVRAKE